jgi:hypothetical protein
MNGLLVCCWISVVVVCVVRSVADRRAQGASELTGSNESAEHSTTAPTSQTEMFSTATSKAPTTRTDKRFKKKP